jgi:sugar/nucleoside kinase (ribokinase family)
MERAPDYLVIGHVSKDVLPGGGVRAGGTATYAAITAQRLGVQAALVTALAEEDEGLLKEAREAGVWVQAVASDATTTFENVYDVQGRRTQIISGVARRIEWSDVPVEWRGASITHLGPVAQELPADMAARFAYGLLGVTPQGWMRAWDGEGKVTQSAWPIPKALEGLPPNTLLVLSIEDLGYRQELVDSYVKLTPLVVVTHGEGEASVYGDRGRKRMGVAALRAKSVDLTGAGDVFAAALMVRYRETGDMEGSVRFAHAAAACAIEGWGTEGIATRDEVLRRIANST